MQQHSPSATCRFFQSSRGCFRGASCAFRHDPNCPIAAAPDARAARSSCHHSTTFNPTTTTTTAPPTTDSSAAHERVSSPLDARTCRFFASAIGCRNGVACPFAHSAVAVAGAPLSRDERPSVAHERVQQPPLPPGYGPVVFDAGAGGRTVCYDRPPRRHPQYEQFQHVELLETATGDEPLSSCGTRGSRYGQQMGHQRRDEATTSESRCEILPVLTRDIQGPFFAIDVECVATGSGNDDRDVARIAVVDEDEQVVFDQYVKPTKPIVSYLTQLTGITESNLADAPDLEEALARLKTILPVESIIVGQSIKKDLEWLMLQKPEDYKGEFDVADLFRLPMQMTNGVVRYRYFSLRHVAKYLLGHEIQEADHDPVIDARYAMKVFKKFRYLHESPGQRDAVLQTLLKTPRTPSFAERYPVIDGVSMRATWKRGPSLLIRNASGIAAGHTQQASNGSYSPQYQQKHEQRPLYS